MAGRIRDEDIAKVRETARIDEVIGAYVTLRSAGGGNLKGLCPFHDEKSPSFNVTPSRGMYHCLAGETEVLTWDGVRQIRDLAGGTHKILGARANWIEAPFKSYGVQPLMKITLTRNRQVQEIFATDEHRWFVRGLLGDPEERLTNKLLAGDELISVFAPGTEPDPANASWVVQSVEHTDRVEEVFCAEVEDGHAFTLADNILTGNCFGCGVGGDAIKFLMEIDGTAFTETVERLAEKVGVELRYEEGGPARSSGGPQRPRLVEAHKLTAAWYAEQLATPDAMTARQFLDQRGFDKDAAAHFGVGFSPRGGDDLVKYLRQQGFTDAELITAGLAGDNNRGVYDKFRGRLMWPIRDSSADVIGFGARRIFDDDRIEAKYLNTAETPIYKKSQVLYGIDLARREIARGSQAVIVEGYTDVMACHLSGVKTAVATCGTAFGDDHARVIRRLLQDHDEFRGEVIFTFDGDEAGQKAALRAFEGDQNFAGQTYVAVEPSGKDPCDLRLSLDSLAEGEAAVRELVARRVPLYRFVLGNVVSRYDLDRADGRVDALREAAKLVRAIRDRSKVDAFARELAGMLGIDPNDVQREVRRAASREQATAAAPSAPAAPQGLPEPRDPRFTLERETLKLVVQHPAAIAPALGEVSEEDFTHPAYRAVWAVVALAGGVEAADQLWASRLQANTADERVQALLSALSVEPIPTSKEATPEYAAVYVHRLRELTAQRRISDLKSKLQRTNPLEEATEYNRMFGELVALEQHRRTLRELAMDQS